MAADPLVGKILADRFEILERIGEGGTGVVYKAKQITVDREVAIKVLGAHVSTDPSWVKRFHNEARAAAKLDHPHTVRVIDFGQTKEGLLFIAMELLHGRSLRDEIDKVGRMPPTRALRIISQGCQSVHEAHGLGIIHRDIKPDNLYLIDTKGGTDFVKVLDFSVAKLDDPNSQQTRAGVVFGTPAYMSPEQGRGGQLGPASDIYAFGVVLYECLAGKPPFDSKIPTEVVMMHLRDKPAPLQGVPEVVSRLVMKALDKDPAKRQKSAEQLSQECEAALAQLTGGVSPSGPQVVVQQQGGASPSGQRPVAQPQQGFQGGGGGGYAGQGYAGQGGGGGQGQQGYGGQAGGNVQVGGAMGAGAGAQSGGQMGGGMQQGGGGWGGGAAGAGGGPSFGPSGGGQAQQQGGGVPQALADQKTMLPTDAQMDAVRAQIAAAQARGVGGGAAPPVGRPPGDLRTMVANEGQMGQAGQAGQMGQGGGVGGMGPPPSGAGYGPPPASWGGGAGAAAAMGGSAAAVEKGPGGTLILPDSQGIITFVEERARAARAAAVPAPPPSRSAGGMFWAAWVVIGVGIGLGIHFLLVHQELAAAAAKAASGT